MVLFTIIQKLSTKRAQDNFLYLAQQDADINKQETTIYISNHRHQRNTIVNICIPPTQTNFFSFWNFLYTYRLLT